MAHVKDSNQQWWRCDDSEVEALPDGPAACLKDLIAPSEDKSKGRGKGNKRQKTQVKGTRVLLEFQSYREQELCVWMKVTFLSCGMSPCIVLSILACDTAEAHLLGSDLKAAKPPSRAFFVACGSRWGCRRKIQVEQCIHALLPAQI